MADDMVKTWDKDSGGTAHAMVAQRSGGWTAALALGGVGESFMFIETADTSATARRWIIDQAKQHGDTEDDITFQQDKRNG